MTQEVKLTTQHQITIPKKMCQAAGLKSGDRLQISVMPDKKLMLKRKQVIDADDPAYRLGREILEAEEQIKQGKTVLWSEIRRRHSL